MTTIEELIKLSANIKEAFPEPSKLIAKAASELEALLKENAELKAANDYNDADKPLDEVMGAISDAVMDFRPDSESDNAGTIVERVKAAVELAKEVNVLRVQLEVSSSEEEIRLRTQNEAMRELLLNARYLIAQIGTTGVERTDIIKLADKWLKALAAQPEGKRGGV